jgi:hypothetical protein
MKRKPHGLSAEEYSKRVDELILKRSRGEKLTLQEERIYAYRDVGRCRCGVRR